jgi:hypothetical protein
MDIITKEEAVQAGLPRYFTGKPCKHGHFSERWTHRSECMECSRNRAKKYIQENKQGARVRSRRHYDKNKELCRARTIEWQRQNKERHAIKVKRWKSKNKAHLAFKAMQRRKHVKVATPSWADMDSIRLRYLEANTMGMLSGVAHHVDHIVPLKGENVCGLHVQSNLRAIPASHNIKKANRLEMPRSSTA